MDVSVTNKGKAAPAHISDYKPALTVLTSLLFRWGLITSLNDIRIAHLKAVFTLSYVKGLGKFSSEGAGVLCMAIVGGAIVPLLQGVFAGHVGVLYSFLIPLACYAYVAFYGLRGHYADFEPAALAAATR